MSGNSNNLAHLCLPIEVAEGEQIGGGCRIPSPPPVQTPTRLQTMVKATQKDIGLVQDAQACHTQLLQAQAVEQEDPFQAVPVAANDSSHMQCTSLLFDHIEPSGNSPFSLHEKTGAADPSSADSDGAF